MTDRTVREIETEIGQRAQGWWAGAYEIPVPGLLAVALVNANEEIREQLWKALVEAHKTVSFAANVRVRGNQAAFFEGLLAAWCLLTGADAEEVYELLPGEDANP